MPSLDYGMANLRSRPKPSRQSDPRPLPPPSLIEIDRADVQQVLPGIGAFKDAIATLNDRHHSPAIIRHIRAVRQAFSWESASAYNSFFDIGYEDGEHPGLAILPGKCIRFDVDQTLGLKVPHMGWNQLMVRKPSPLFRDLPADAGLFRARLPRRPRRTRCNRLPKRITGTARSSAASGAII